MTTAAADNHWPPSSPPLRSSPIPDTTSPVTGRAIRPLPKRRLRDRLSSEQSDTIQLPPQPPHSSPIFAYPHAQGERENAEHRPIRAASGASDQQPCLDCDDGQSEGYGEEDEDDERQRTMQFSPRSLQITRRHGDFYGTGKAAMADWESKPARPGSATSSAEADGYESFEHTKNKKKRKIPQSNIHHNTLSSDMANMGISPRDDSADMHDQSGFAAASYGHNTPSPTGSGAAPGRSKYGRTGRGSLDRRPLGASTNGLNATAAGGRARQVPIKPAGTSPVEPGIISTAIANAQQTPTTPTKGQENISLLQQQAAKSPPQKTDFTFTPEGGENRPVWPGQQMPPGFDPAGHQGVRQGDRTGYRRNGVAHGTQTSPSMNGAAQMPPGPNQTQGQATAGAQPPSPKGKKPRRGRAYQLAARRRRLQQEYQNFHNPPKREDIWICEFCEYETIFGTPPTALIRQYEAKDRKERKRIEERRRLLEKAKMKGRKGKKGSNKKNNANNPVNNSNSNQQSAATNNQRDDAPLDDQLGEEEYYEDDEYEYPAETAMDPPPTPHPAAHTHSHTQAGADPGYLGNPSISKHFSPPLKRSGTASGSVA